MQQPVGTETCATTFRQVHIPDRLETASEISVRGVQSPVWAAWLVRQFQRGVDDSERFERFVPKRYAHGASDLVEPIGSLAARLCAMRSVQLSPQPADASFGAVSQGRRPATASAPQPGHDEPMTYRSQRPQRM